MPEDPSETPPGGAAVSRPQTSSRDLAELRRRLERWLAQRIPCEVAPHISDLEVPASNGMSCETVLFDVSWRRDDGERSEALVARIAPQKSAVPVFRVYDMHRQFRVMQQVATASSVPVPRVLWSEPDAGPVGEPFFVMERVMGRVPPDLMPYNFGSWLSEASAEERVRLQASTVRVFAGLHGIPDVQQRFGFLELKAAGQGALRRHVADQWDFYRWVANGVRSPLIERGFAWLEDHWPAHEGPTVLSWGDARIGNILYRDFEPVAVLDWEIAALGPRELDVAWLIFQHRFFEDIAQAAGLPGMPDFMRRNEVAAAYEAESGHAPRDLDFYTLYAALQHAIIMSRVQRRAIHFGEAAMPDDADDLIMHRTTLESMLAGRYWRGPDGDRL